MSYGKYGMKMNVPAANQQFVLNSNDPWYNLGGILGTIWGNNYNRRGEQKAEDEMRRILGGLQAPENAVSNQPLPENLSNADSVMGRNVQIPDSLYNQYATARAIGTAPVARDSADYVNANKTVNAPASNIPKMQDTKVASVNESKGMPKSNLNGQIPQRDVAAEKWDAFNRTYGDPNTENPVADRRAIGTMTDAVKNGLATMDLSKLPMTDLNRMKQLLVAEARRNGRTDYQIERAWANVAPDVEAKVQEAKDTKWGDYQNILNQQIQSGELDNAMLTYAEMAKLDPVKTKALQYKVDRMWEPFKIDRKYDLEKDFYKKRYGWSDKDFDNFKQTGDTRYSKKDAEALGFTSRGGVLGNYSVGTRASSGGGGGRRRASGSPSAGVSDMKFTEINGRIKLNNDLISAYESDPTTHGGISAEQYNAAKTANAKMYQQLNNGFADPTMGDFQSWVDNELANGASAEEINDAIRNDSNLTSDQRLQLINHTNMRTGNTGNGYTPPKYKIWKPGESKQPSTTTEAPKVDYTKRRGIVKAIGSNDWSTPNAKGHTGVLKYLDKFLGD